jgi:hypothetical protein
MRKRVESANALSKRARPAASSSERAGIYLGGTPTVVFGAVAGRFKIPSEFAGLVDAVILSVTVTIFIDVIS